MAVVAVGETRPLRIEHDRICRMIGTITSEETTPTDPGASAREQVASFGVVMARCRGYVHDAVAAEKGLTFAKFGGARILNGRSPVAGDRVIRVVRNHLMRELGRRFVICVILVPVRTGGRRTGRVARGALVTRDNECVRVYGHNVSAHNFFSGGSWKLARGTLRLPCPLP